MALFGGTKPDHPMADIRLAKKLISELPANDAAKALDEVTFWLDSVSNTEGFKLDYRFELLDVLDQAAKPHQRKLAQEYLATDRQEKFRENKLWTTVFEFWKMLGSAYTQCIEQFQSGAGGAGAIKKDLPVIIARTMRSLTLQLKWILQRYGPVDDRVYGELGRLYVFAENKGIATNVVGVYPGPHGEGSVQQEFLKAMMLGVSSTDGLTPIKQEIAERTVAHFGEMYVLQSAPGLGSTYFFDLSMRKAAARVSKDFEPNKMTRFFGAGKALSALSQLIHEIRSKDAIPAHINLGGTYDPDLVLSVLQHLALYWPDKAPSRGSERRKIATRLTVVHGFQQMIKSIAPVDDETSVDAAAQEGSESWIVENVSDGGFGAIIPPVKGDWIKVGNLLGVQTETARFWGTGVIRRITRDEYQQRRVGIQLLSKAVIPIRLSPAGTISSFNATREHEPAVLLSTAPDKNGEVDVLLRGGSFTPAQALEMNVRGKQYYLMPSRLVESGDDFDWTKFKVVQQP